MKRSVNFLKRMGKTPYTYPTIPQVAFLIALFAVATWQLTPYENIDRSTHFVNEYKLIRDQVRQKENQAQRVLNNSDSSSRVVAVSRRNIRNNIKFSQQLNLITSYLKPGIWLQSLLFDRQYNFSRIQGVSVSSQRLSNFYQTIIDKNEIIGLPFKVVFIGNTSASIIRMKANKQRSLLASVSELNAAVSRFRNRQPNIEKRLNQIPFLFQTAKLNARYSELMRYGRR